jgi:uncharacterized protein GlcG (DUF336 family)
MSKLLSIFALLALIAILTGEAAAQAPAPAPAPVPDAQPFDVPYGAPITLDQAKKAMTAAEAEARRRNWKCGIAIVDPSGDLVLLVKMDGAQNAASKIAEGKARTAALFRRPGKIFFDAMESGHPYVMSLLPGLVAADGSFPIIENGKVIGAIGTSGGTGAQDGIVAKAGADTIK